MPIRTTCPQCDAVYNVADNMTGKRVRCKKCDNTFAVQAGPKERLRSDITAEKSTGPRKPPALRDREQEDRSRVGTAPRSLRRRDEDDAPVASAFPVRWLIGGGVGVLVLIIGCVTMFVLMRPSSSSNDSSSSSSPTKAGGGDVPIVNLNPNPNRRQKDPQPIPQAQPVQPIQGQPIQAQPEQGQPIQAQPLPPQPIPPRPRAPRVDPAPAAAVAWNVKPDPAAQKVQIPDNVQGVLALSGFSPLIIFPSAPSPYVLVSQRVGPRDMYLVLDLGTFKKFAGPFVAGTGLLGEPHALSPDGTLAAGKVNEGNKPVVDVWSTANSQRAARIMVASAAGFTNVHMVEFAGPGQLVTGKSSGPDLVFQVWDHKTGAEQCQFTAPAQHDRKLFAISAGGKYLAAVGKNNDRVLIYDLTTGAAAGEALVSKNGVFSPTCQGLAFSPDGKALAGIFHAGSGGRIVSWDMATGQVKADHSFAENLQNTAKNAFFYKGRPLEWLSDGSGWLAFGQLLIDAEKGNLFWKIPTETMDGLPRRLFGTNRLALVKGDQTVKALSLDKLPADQLAAALAAIQAGEDPAATRLPAAKAADWAAVRNLPAAGGAVGWKAAPDAAPARKAMAKSIPLKGKAGELAAILFASPDAAQAVVLTASATSDVATRKQVHVDRYDLAAGKQLGGADLFSAEPLQGQPFQLDAAFSPDGALLAVKEPRESKRVDVWSMAEGKHVAGWLPFEKEGDGVIRWVGFLDAARLLTLNGAGKLVLWQFPECRAVWELDGCRSAPAISPGRKYLTVFTGSTIELLDVAGERKGTLSGPGVRNVWASAFRSDGLEYAAVIQTVEGGNALARWNAATGESLGEFPVQMISNDVYHTDMKWCGNDHVMLQNNLIDLKLKWTTVNCILSGTGRQATGSPDGRHWFAVSPNPNAPPVLLAQTFPDDVTKALAQGVATNTVRPVLSPGMSVSLRVEGAGPAGEPDFHKRITENLTKNLQTHGLKVADNAPAVLVVSFQPERDTGQKVTYRSIGGRPSKNTDVTIMEVACEATLTDGGSKIWERKQTFKTPEPFGIVRTDDITATLSKSLWRNCQNWGSSAALPSGMVRTATGIVSLPKPLLLTGDR